MFNKRNNVELYAFHMVACWCDVLMISLSLETLLCHRVSEAELGQSLVMPSNFNVTVKTFPLSTKVRTAFPYTCRRSCYVSCCCTDIVHGHHLCTKDPRALKWCMRYMRVLFIAGHGASDYVRTRDLAIFTRGGRFGEAKKK